MPDTTVVRTSRDRWTAIVIIGIVLSLALGVMVFVTSPTDERALAATVFVLLCGPLFFAGAWALIPDPDAADPVTHAEDTVERAWAQRAGFGAFTNLVAVMGLAALAQYAMGMRALPVPVFLVLGLLSFGVRYLVASRRPL